MVDQNDSIIELSTDEATRPTDPSRPASRSRWPKTHLLIATLEALWDKADRYRRLGLELTRSQADRDQKAHEHAALMNAVVRGDTAGAAEIMREHINTSLGANAVRRLGSDGRTLAGMSPLS